MHGTAPTYVTNLLSFKHSRYNLRSVGNNTLARPEIKSATTTGDRAFPVAAPLLWNALLLSLRAIDNITSFKKHEIEIGLIYLSNKIHPRKCSVRILFTHSFATLTRSFLKFCDS